MIVEACGITRHIQLKAMQAGGRRRDFDIQTRLATRPSGCVVVLLHDPVTLAITGRRLFAGAPGQPLPPLGERAVRHAKGDATGHKAARPALRRVPLTRFEAVADIAALTDRLFGPPALSAPEQSLGS